MVLGCFTLIGCVFAFAFARHPRDSYVAMLALSVVLGAIFCTAAQGPLKYAICAAFAARVTNEGTFEGSSHPKIVAGNPGTR
jgi:hypothetical protein